MDLSFICDQKWEGLQGSDSKRRSCDVCDKPVYNLSGMTRKQARVLLASHGENPPCVRFVIWNGSIVHDGDPFERLRKQRHGARYLVAGALALHLSLATFASDPQSAFLSPLNILHVLNGDFYNPFELTGAPANDTEMKPIVYASHERVSSSLTRAGAIDRAREAVESADWYAGFAQKDMPPATYLEFRELNKAQLYLELNDIQDLPNDLIGLAARTEEARYALEDLVMTHEVQIQLYIDKKMYPEARQELRELQGCFYDRQNIWTHDLDVREAWLLGR
jgi:hypothetical protein